MRTAQNTTRQSMNRLVPTAAALCAALVALTGCPETPKPLPAPPHILSFSVDAPTLDAPGSVLLSWKVEGATSVSISDAEKGVIAGVDDRAEGTLEVAVERDALFVLTAANERGVKDSAVVTVTVNDGAREVLFVSTPASVSPGDQVTLSWSAHGAREVSLAVEGGAAIDLGGQLTSGAVIVTPTTSTTWVLTVDGARYTTGVTVLPAVLSFTANPELVKPGQEVVLSWQTAAVTEVAIEAPGKGAIFTSSSRDEALSGSFVFTVPATIGDEEFLSFRLVARGEQPESEASRTLELFVTGKPRVTQFAAPEYALTGGTFQVNWATVNADAVELAIGTEVFARVTDPARVAQGSMTLNTPTATTTYTLYAVDGRGARHSASATVDPVGPPTLNSFTATPGSGISAGDAVTLTWDVTNARNVRITAVDESVVYTLRGLTAPQGSVTVHPGKDTEYLLEADNTVGGRVSSSANVTVAPASFTLSPATTVIVGSPVQLDAANVPAGSVVYGAPHSDIEVNPQSTGFIDIEGTGELLPLSLSSSTAKVTFVPDFETWMFGDHLSGAVTVSVNGHLAFGTTVTSSTANKPLPNAAVTPLFLSPLWVYLKLGDDSGVYWQVVGDAPERTLIVQWTNMVVNNDPASRITFQAQIHQTGAIRFEYQTISTTSTLVPVIGVQGAADGIEGLQAQLGWPSSGSSVSFFGPKALPVTVKVFPAESTYSGAVKIGQSYLRMPVKMLPTLPRGRVRITEVMAQPAAAVASTGEWLEIFNPGPDAIDLDGWTLEFGASGSHTLSSAIGPTTLAPGEVRIFGQSADPAENDGVAVGYVYGPSFTLADGAGQVSINKVGPADEAAWNSTAGVSMIRDPGPVLYAVDPTGTVPRALECTPTTREFGNQVPKQLGTPGKPGGCYAYTLARIPGNFEVLPSTATDVLPTVTGNTGYRNDIPLPAPFTFFGAQHTLFNASTSGFITFGTTTTHKLTGTVTANPTKPATTNPNGVVAVFWDSLNRRTEGKLRMQRNSDHTVISWQNFRYSSDTNGDYSFQVKLFDNGVIEYHYGPMISGASTYDNYATGDWATTWLESPAGDSAAVANINTAGGIQPSVGFRFIPN